MVLVALLGPPISAVTGGEGSLALAEAGAFERQWTALCGRVHSGGEGKVSDADRILRLVRRAIAGASHPPSSWLHRRK